MTTFTGQCLCGHVKYKADVDKLTLAQCHCKNCQRHSGSAFSLNLMADMTKVDIDKTLLSCYKDTGDNGNPVFRYSCKNCHSILISGNEDLSGTGALKVGSLNDTSTLKPTASIWESSAQPWVVMCNDVYHFDKNAPRK